MLLQCVSICCNNAVFKRFQHLKGLCQAEELTLSFHMCFALSHLNAAQCLLFTAHCPTAYYLAPLPTEQYLLPFACCPLSTREESLMFLHSVPGLACHWQPELSDLSAVRSIETISVCAL